MAPVATQPQQSEENGVSKHLKAKDTEIFDPSDLQEKIATFNPFYSPPGDVSNDDSYEYERYKPYFPKVDWPTLKPFDVTDRATFADPEKRALLSAASKVTHLTPAIGTEIEGIDLRQLSDKQKDELALLTAERGVVFFRNQPLDVHQQLDIARHYGTLHKHATTPIPKEPGLEEVHVVYNDSARRPDPSAFTKLELWHSDVSYELQPPSTTSLKGITIPPVGGDTHWSSGYALYSSLSPGFQQYLEGLTAVHSGVAQAVGSRSAGLHVRRQEVETVHPVVRVHPVTKAESDAILQFLFSQISENPDFQVRFRWERDSIAFWDNRVVTHSATFDFWPHRRHALRATPHGERPLSVAQYEQKTGKKARDWQQEIWRALGVSDPLEKARNAGTNGGPRGYND